MKVNIDFRDEMREWIRDYGINILYQRTSKYIKCSCIDPLYRQPNVSCKICNGSGKLIKTEKLKILPQELYPTNKSGSIDYTNFGQIFAPTMNFYFTEEDKPRIKDIIYMVGWINGIASSLVNIFEITLIEAFRGDNGRIEYYFISSKSRPELMENGQKYINRLRRV